MQPQKLLKHQRCLVCVGVCLVVSGAVLLLTTPLIFDAILNSELVLAPGKHSYNVWKKTPIPLTLEFYFFNWTNPEDLHNKSVKPRLQELGPYRFRETKEKVDVKWHDNGTVSFRQLRWWYFDAERSNGSLDDEITTLNVIAVTAAAQSKRLNYMMQKAMSLSMNALSGGVHVTQSVRELLFEGYKDTMIDIARNLPALDGVELPPFDRFGWFYMRNGSTDFDGLLTMGTGKAAEAPLGELQRWNRRRRTGFYEGECGRVSGSAGEFWPQHVSREDIAMFSPDMCRSVGFQFEREVLIRGLPGYRFIGGPKTMDNGSVYPENSCYCGGECVPSGVLNVSSCRFGSPGFISFPHFYLADPVYIQQFEGLSPDRDQHELSITLEPRTGIPLAVSAKFQINILMTPNENIGLFSNVPRLFFPMIWFKQEVEIPEAMAADLRQLLLLPVVGEAVAATVLACGALLLAALVVQRLYHVARARITHQSRHHHHKEASVAISPESVPLNTSA